MSKGQNGDNLFILIGCVSGLFVISSGMAIWILTGFRTSIKRLFDKHDKIKEEFDSLKGRCKERHK